MKVNKKGVSNKCTVNILYQILVLLCRGLICPIRPSLLHHKEGCDDVSGRGIDRWGGVQGHYDVPLPWKLISFISSLRSQMLFIGTKQWVAAVVHSLHPDLITSFSLRLLEFWNNVCNVTTMTEPLRYSGVKTNFTFVLKSAWNN